MLKLKRVEHVLLFLVLLFLPTQLGKHFWPSFSFVYSLPIDYLSPTVYFWDLIVLCLMISFLLQGNRVNKTALNLLLLFLLSQTFSLVQNINNPQILGVGLVRVEQYFISGLFGLYLASINITAVDLKIFWSLQLAILISAFLALLQFLKSETLGLWILGERTFSLSTPGIAKFDFYGRQFLRPYATFPHPNVLSAFMVISTIISWFILTADKFKTRSLFKITTLMAILITFLTVSRTAILAGLITALALLKKRLLIVLIIFLVLLSPYLYTRFSSTFNFDNLALLRREELIEAALKIWQTSPFFGVGLNNFIPKASDQILIGPSRFLQPVHNIFLLSLSETGIFGVFGLLVLLGFPILRILKLRSINYKLNTLMLAWILVIFLGLFDHYFLTLPQGIRMLFLLWGLSLSVLE